MYLLYYTFQTPQTQVFSFTYFFFYFYYADFNKYPLFLNQYYMNGKVFKNIVGYGDLMKARTKFVHPSQCFDGERQRNIFKIIE